MLLKQLTETSGVSGNEKEVRELIISEIRDHVDSYKIDNIGNIIAYKKGKSSDKRLMVTAHMDEVGLMVKEIDDLGLIKFLTVGGIDKRILVSKPVRIGEKKIVGVIGAKPIHLQKKSEWTRALDLDELYIDIGVSSKKEAEKLVNIGDYISFDSEYIEFGQGMIKAKALDNRVGCAILIDLIKEIKDTEFYAVFTTMEEIGLIGAGPAAYEVKPDISIVLEGTICYDMPELDSHMTPTYINGGPAISLIDRTTVFDHKLRNKIVDIATKNSIPFQYRKSAMGGNDSGKIHISGEGSITSVISVPCRYIHSFASVMSEDDYENTYKLLLAILSDFKKERL